MAGNATKSSSLTHISQATLDEISQSVKTTVLIDGEPVSHSNPLPIDANITVQSIQTTSNVRIEANNQSVSDSNPLPVYGSVDVDGLKVNGFYVSQSNPLPVDLTDVEIAVSLNKNSDSVQSFQGESSPGVVVPWKVESENLDIRNINHTIDSIKIGNGSTFLHIDQDGSINTVSVLEQTYLSANIIVGTSQIEIKTGISRLSSRKMVSVHNYGPNIIYIGPSGVTSTTGRPLFVDQCMDMPIGNMAVYAISEEPGNSIIVQEIG